MSSSPVNPASLGNLPDAPTLPDELWIKILLELDYLDLKKGIRVCKKSQRLISDPKFDHILFRAMPPEPPLEEGEDIEIHPALEAIECFLEDSAEEHTICGKNDFDFPIKDFPSLLQETATSPASCIVDISAPAEPMPNTLYRQTGVTIGDVLDELTRYMGSKPVSMYFDPEDEVALGMEGWWKGEWIECVAMGDNHTIMAHS